MNDNSRTSWRHQYHHHHHHQSSAQQQQQPYCNTINPSIIHRSTFGSETWLLAPITVTLTDIIYSTTQVATTTITTTPYEEYITNDSNNNLNNNIVNDNNNNALSHLLYQLLPVLGLFAVIGLLTVLVLLGYMGYRFYRLTVNNSNNNRGQRRRLRNDNDMGWSNSDEEGGGIGRRGGTEESEPMVFDNPTRELKGQYAWSQNRPVGGILDSPIENSEQPISSTFIPITTSPLTLVPRMEVWEDPQRRRGVDELDLWERKQQKQRQTPQPQQLQQQSSDDYSPRSSSETVQLGSGSSAATQPATHIAMARKALEKSRLENSSSQWLQPSGSQNL